MCHAPDCHLHCAGPAAAGLARDEGAGDGGRAGKAHDAPGHSVDARRGVGMGGSLASPPPGSRHGENCCPGPPHAGAGPVRARGGQRYGVGAVHLQQQSREGDADGGIQRRLHGCAQPVRHQGNCRCPCGDRRCQDPRPELRRGCGAGAARGHRAPVEGAVDQRGECGIAEVEPSRSACGHSDRPDAPGFVSRGGLPVLGLGQRLENRRCAAAGAQGRGGATKAGRAAGQSRRRGAA